MSRSKVLLINSKIPLSKHPKCIVAIDKESMINPTQFKNLIGDSPVFDFNISVPINKETGGLVFKANNIGGAPLPKQGLRKYTVLVHANPDSGKSENDVIGSGSITTTDMLLMVYLGVIRPHQWPLVGGPLIIQGNTSASQYFGQMVDGSAITTLSLINNKKVEQQSVNNTYGSELRPYMTIGGRAFDYYPGFFSGEIYAVRWYDDVLTQQEILDEFENMEARRAN